MVLFIKRNLPVFKFTYLSTEYLNPENVDQNAFKPT